MAPPTGLRGGVREWLLATALFWTLMAAALVTFHQRGDPYARPWVWFALPAVATGVLVFQALAAPPGSRYVALLVTQCLALTAVVAGTQVSLFASLLGVDPWGHALLTSEILSTHRLPPADAYANDVWPLSDIAPYARLPVFHLMTSTAMGVGGLGYKAASILFVGTGILLLELLSTYVLSRHLFSRRVALVAMVLVASADNVLDLAGKTITPNGLAFSMVILTIFILARLGQGASSRAILLLLPLATAVLLTHIVSYQVLIVQCVAFLGVRSLRSSSAGPGEGTQSLRRGLLFLTILLAVAGLFYWNWVNSVYVERYATIGEELLQQRLDPGYYGSSLTTSFSDVLLGRLGMIVFFLLAMGGTIKCLRPRPSSQLLVIMGLTIFGATVGVLAILNPALIGVAHRFWHYGEVVAGGLAAVSVLALASVFRSTGAGNMTASALVAGLAFFMFVAPIASDDNPLPPSITPRTGLMDSELAAQHFFQVRAPEVLLSSDTYYASRAVYSGHDPTRIAYPGHAADVIDAPGIGALRLDGLTNRAVTFGPRFGNRQVVMDADGLMQLRRGTAGSPAVVYDVGTVVGTRGL